MTLEASLIVNCDDAVIFWRIKARIADCWGFAIERERKRADGTVERQTLDNRMGFKGDKPKRGEHRSSKIWPLQRFWWADHEVNLGDKVRYRVIPMVREGDVLRELLGQRSKWTAWALLSGGAQDGYASFFNRGLVISQFMSRYLEDLRVRDGLATRKAALAAFKKSLSDHELPIRRFLAGALRTRMLELLAQAQRSGQQVYAALYELADSELIDALAALGASAHVVLANGSITAAQGEPAAQARQRDQNAQARAALRTAGVEVLDRFTSPGALGHNKFLVITDKLKQPRAVWTGSTNWTSTGLCTQINNGLLISNREVAREYFAQWQRLADAKSAFPATLVDSNSLPKTVTTGASSATIWFTRTRGAVDLEAINEVLQSAQEGVLFLMFQPGGAGALGTVRKLQKERPALYIKGVVSTLPADSSSDSSSDSGSDSTGDGGAVSVALHGATGKSSVDLNVVQPSGFKTPFANLAATVTRSDFITGQGGVIGYAIVHSKLIVVDPFTRPTVITGSHNFSKSASAKNDENFVIVRGNRELALHYGAHILSVYHHYRWLAFVSDLQSQGKPLSGFLRENDRWQDSRLSGPARRELDFWVR